MRLRGHNAERRIETGINYMFPWLLEMSQMVLRCGELGNNIVNTAVERMTHSLIRNGVVFASAGVHTAVALWRVPC